MYSEASIILDFRVIDPRILMEFESIIELTYLNEKRLGLAVGLVYKYSVPEYSFKNTTLGATLTSDPHPTCVDK